MNVSKVYTLVLESSSSNSCSTHYQPRNHGDVIQAVLASVYFLQDGNDNTNFIWSV